VVETFPAAKVHLIGGKTAEAKMHKLRSRVKRKERRAARTQRQVDALVESFICEVETDGMEEHQPGEVEQRRMVAPEWALAEAERAKSEEDRLAAAFWNSLGDAQACSEHVQLVQDRPSCDYSRGTVQGERRRNHVKQVKQHRDRK